jgi:hypothetical protein
MIDDGNQICENCQWYNPSHAGTHGYCKVNPPVFTHLDENGRPRFFSPVVSPHNTCSLFEDID